MNNILKDVEVKLSEEFDRNFQRKAFFDRPWPKTKLVNNKGSMLARTNSLRRSVNSKMGTDSITWSSSLPYASIHNDGGEIAVTAKMKKFFWYKYYEASGKMSTKKDGSLSNNKRNQRLNLEAEQWKALALMPVGKMMKIDQRQFIGDHPQVQEAVKTIIDRNMRIFSEELTKKFKSK